MTLVTIGLNTFNAEDTVEAALRSAMGQDWPELEIVVVDDASSDGTVAVLERVAQEDGRVRILRNAQNSGLAAGRNRVIAEARGAFVVFFDDDDVSRPHRVRAQVERISRYEERVPGAMVICHAAREQVYPNGLRRIEHTMGEDEGALAPAGRAVAERMLFGRPLAHAYGSVAGCSQAARTDAFRKLGGFDTFFRREQDMDFCIRAALAGAHFAGIGEPLVTQQMTGGSDKGLARERQFRRALLEKHRAVFRSERHFQFCLAWTDLRMAWLGSRRGEFFGRLGKLALLQPVWVAQRFWEARRQADGNRAARRFHAPTAGR
jgi:glycosyltransferase involved in cell wall biosynthesis